jgi:predicted Zn-dependent protease
VSTAAHIAERALDLSRSDGCIVIVTQQSATNVRWANNALTTNGVTSSQHVTVVATCGSATGTSTGVVSRCGVVGDDALPDLVRAAESAASSAEPAEDAAPLVVGDGVSPHWSAPVPDTSLRVFAGFTPALGDMFSAARAGDVLLFGYAEHTVQSRFLASSSGVRRRHDQASGHVQLTGKPTDGRRSAWAGAAGQEFTDSTVAALYGQIEQRLQWARRQVDLPAGRYETVLPPAAVADLMNYVYWSGGARDAVEGHTVYSAPGGGTRIGERLTDLPLTLRGDPAAPGLECSPFVLTGNSDGIVSVFDNGLPLQSTAWIDRGVLSALLQTRYSAGLTGMALTPHIDNLILEADGGAGSAEDLAARTGSGLLLTTLWYIREVDLPTLLLTGLTRDGVYMLEQGEVVGAVNNFRFNERPVDLLRRVIEAGATEPTRAREWGDAFSHSAMPALRVADFQMSSVSRAI